MISERARGGEFAEFLVKKPCVFEVFMLKSLKTQCVWYDFSMIRDERARVDFVVFFARDY